MPFNALTPALVSAFEQIVTPAHVLTAATAEAQQYDAYGRDHTEDFHFAPDVVLRPGTPEEVSAILKLCHAHQVPVTARGPAPASAAGPTHP